MFPVINLGPLAIQTPGLFLLFGLWLGLWLAEKNLTERGIAPNIFNNLVLLSLIAGVFGGRISYAIQFADAFLRDPFSLLSLNTSLFDIRGGLVFVLFAGLIYGGKKGLSFWNTMDALTPLFGVLTIALGFSYLASGTNYGISSNLPWSIELHGEKRHPTQMYQILISTSILFILWPGRAKIQDLKPGQYFLLYISASSFGYIFLNSFTQNINALIGGFRSTQILAWIVLALSIWGYKRLSQTATNQEI